MSDAPPASPVEIDLIGRTTAFQTAVPLGMQPLPPLFIYGSGVLVAGGPTSLCLFTANDGATLTPCATIAAQDWITGFTFHEGSLYVQDGCVLGKWDLTGVCTAAFNLATGARCDGAATAAVLQLPDNLAGLEQALNVARRREAWATLLGAGERLASDPGGGPSAADAPGLDGFLQDLRIILGSAHPAAADPSLVLPEVQAARRAAESAGAAVVFSTPVVRQNQADALTTETVFVLGGDGVLHRLNDLLSTHMVSRFDTAVLPQLAGNEPPDPSNPGAFGMQLLYATADGNLRLVDADPGNPRMIGSWDAQGEPDPDQVLALAAVDGLLWGGGLLGATLFALPPTPPAAAVLSVAEPASDWSYAVDPDPDEKLVLLTDGTRTRLLAYAPDAVVQDRWGEHTPPGPSWTVFGPPSTPRLLLEIDQQVADGASAPGFRVYVGNTVVDPLDVTVFPPPAAVATGTLTSPGQTLAAVLAPPVVAGGSLYLVGATASLAQQVAALFTPVGGSTPWSTFAGGLIDPTWSSGPEGRPDPFGTPHPVPLVLVLSPAVPPATLAAAVPPPAANVAFVCPLAGLNNADVTAAANAYLQRTAALAGAVALRVYRQDFYSQGRINPTWSAPGAPFCLANQPIQISGVTVDSDASGLVRLPASWFGTAVTVQDDSSDGTNESGSVTLVQGQVNTVTIIVKHFRAGTSR